MFERLDQKKADIHARRKKIEEAHVAGKISEAEYYSLISQLKMELDNYIAQGAEQFQRLAGG